MLRLQKFLLLEPRSRHIDASRYGFDRRFHHSCNLKMRPWRAKPPHQREGLPCVPADGMRWKPPAGRAPNSGWAVVQARPRSAPRQTEAIGRSGDQQAATEVPREQIHPRVAPFAQARLAGRLPSYEFTSKYMQSGCWNTKALTLASGSIMSPSVSVTPISAGSSSLNSPRWSSRFGQAAYPKL